MPARDPMLSPRTLTHKSGGPPQQHQWSSLYLPDTSAHYDSDDDSSEAHQARPRSPPVASGSGLAESVGQSPKRPILSRRGSSSTAKSYSDNQDGIRARTAFLADLPYRLPSMTHISASIPSSHSGPNLISALPKDKQKSVEGPSIDSHENSLKVPGEVPAALPTVQERDSSNRSRSPSPPNPSGLSILMARDKSRSPRDSPERQSAKLSDDKKLLEAPSVVVLRPDGMSSSSDISTPTTIRPNGFDSEQTPLLSNSVHEHTYGPYDYIDVPPKAFLPRVHERVNTRLHALSRQMSPLAHLSTYKNGAVEAVHCLPAVILGLLLNILDGVSYGFIMFPAGAIFSGFGGLGVSMFFVTTIVAQLTYTLGGSKFAGGNGSMMIEVVPFFHLIVSGIIDVIGEDKPEEIIATTMVAFAFSSILTGITFFTLGAFKLGNLIGFFPRHILVGCIGGVGVFLVETGLEVSASINEAEGFTYTLETFKLFFTNAHVLTLWVPAFALAVLLRLITARYHHQLIFPLYFLTIPCIFYIVIAILGKDVESLRASGWIFNVGTTHDPWYKFYTYFDFRKTSFEALWAVLPTQLALLFFNILHPPLNVPALAVSLNEDNVDTNRELVAHGVSNFLAGVFGVVPNYLVYVNTVLFYRVGGGSRISGFLLAIGTAVLLVIGTGPIGYIPIMVVGALIFVLGIDLIKEAVWDTRHRTSTTQYTGASSMSAVRRPSAHREYLRQVGKQTVIMRLQGFLFFGTINHVEDTIRHLLDASWATNPIRFLIIDFSLVGGCDMSAAEAFVRVQRLLSAKRVVLIFCGCAPDSAVAKALQGVELWADSMPGVEVFLDLNEALEWTENAYLKAWFSGPIATKVERVDKPIPFPGQFKQAPFDLGESYVNSPRRLHIHDVGVRVMPQHDFSPTKQEQEPVNTLMKTFSSFPILDESLFEKLVPYLKQIVVPEGHVLFEQGDQPDGLYIIEHGVLRASYRFVEHAQIIEESMVSGTLAGELSALSSLPRNATVVAERQSVLWMLTLKELERMEREHPDAARVFTKLVLKAAKTDYDVLLASLASRA
ncbi:hypothetical protein FRC03_007589 [Tulasnella sp. 419]|nr:hypothetical protein FRC03_007589 [Tulasnella sp. 419]